MASSKASQRGRLCLAAEHSGCDQTPPIDEHFDSSLGADFKPPVNTFGRRASDAGDRLAPARDRALTPLLSVSSRRALRTTAGQLRRPSRPRLIGSGELLGGVEVADAGGHLKVDRRPRARPCSGVATASPQVDGDVGGPAGQRLGERRGPLSRPRLGMAMPQDSRQCQRDDRRCWPAPDRRNRV